MVRLFSFGNQPDGYGWTALPVDAGVSAQTDNEQEKSMPWVSPATNISYTRANTFSKGNYCKACWHHDGPLWVREWDPTSTIPRGTTVWAKPNSNDTRANGSGVTYYSRTHLGAEDAAQRDTWVKKLGDVRTDVYGDFVGNGRFYMLEFEFGELTKPVDYANSHNFWVLTDLPPDAGTTMGKVWMSVGSQMPDATNRAIRGLTSRWLTPMYLVKPPLARRAQISQCTSAVKARGSVPEVCVMPQLCTGPDIKFGGICADWCAADPASCDLVKIGFCKANPLDPFCDCIAGDTRPEQIAYMATLSPEAANQPKYCKTRACKRTDLSEVFVLRTDRKDQCPDMNDYRQTTTVSGSGNILQTSQSQNSTGGTGTAAAATAGGLSATVKWAIGGIFALVALIIVFFVARSRRAAVDAQQIYTEYPPTGEVQWQPAHGPRTHRRRHRQAH